MVSGIFALIGEFILGPALDIYGRRKIFLIAYFTSAISQFMIPFIGTNELWFLISKCIGIGVLLTSTIPLVPDYFMPSSFGLVNTWRAVFKNIGAI